MPYPEELQRMAQHSLVPHLDFQRALPDAKQLTRVWIETKALVDYDLWPYVFKKAAQLFLASLEVQPSGYNVLINIVLPSLVDAM